MNKAINGKETGLRVAEGAGSHRRVRLQWSEWGMRFTKHAVGFPYWKTLIKKKTQNETKNPERENGKVRDYTIKYS